MTKRLVPDPDLEALISKLNSAARGAPELPEETEDAGQSGPVGGHAVATRAPRWPAPAWSEDGDAWLESLLHETRKAHASDLLLVAATPPVARINGRLVAVADRELTPEATRMLCGALLPATRREALEAAGAVDFAFTRGELGRFRCNIHRERDHWSAAVRLLPESVRDLESLNLPQELARFTEMEHGLVLVTGPTGCGKSTTLAALIRRVLSRRRVHLITIEDPVEFEHPHGGSVVEHIEIGRDARSFAEALRSAMRQDPDVILIGEMRDPESIGIAITAAETGHLVFSTLHTGDAPQTINRILDSYPANQMETVRVQLSISLAGIVSQQLIPRQDGGGRVPAVEILVATNAVRNLIRQGKIAHIRSQFTFEKNAGMLELDRSLADLVRGKLIDRGEARARARTVDEFDQLVQRKR